jgi:hypothetical protein
MARDRQQKARLRLLRDAAALAGIEPVAVLIVNRLLEVIVAEEPTPPTPAPAGLAVYDAAIMAALTDRALSSQRLANRAGHRHNSYFRERLAALVEAGHVRHTRRGYSRPGG